MSRGAAGENGQENNSDGAGGRCASADCTALPLRNFMVHSFMFHFTDPQQHPAASGGPSLPSPEKHCSSGHKGIKYVHSNIVAV